MTRPMEASGETGPIAVLCALDSELAHLRAELPPAREVWHAGRCAWLTAIGRRPILLSICGIGMVSAAAVAEAVIGRFAPSVLLNCGCAGAHRPDLLPGDVVIGARVVAYDSVSESPDGTKHYDGMRYLRGAAHVKAEFLAADSTLLDAAMRVATAERWQPEPWPSDAPWPDSVSRRPPRLVAGTIASASRWNRTAASIEALVAEHDSLCEDMEAAAIALTCASHDVPFLAIKDISNNELHQNTMPHVALEAQVGEDQLGRRAASLVLGILRDLVETTTIPSVYGDRQQELEARA